MKQWTTYFIEQSPALIAKSGTAQLERVPSSPLLASWLAVTCRLPLQFLRYTRAKVRCSNRTSTSTWTPEDVTFSTCINTYSPVRTVINIHYYVTWGGHKSWAAIHAPNEKGIRPDLHIPQSAADYIVPDREFSCKFMPFVNRYGPASGPWKTASCFRLGPITRLYDA